jgi:hypothetical protein
MDGVLLGRKPTSCVAGPPLLIVQNCKTCESLSTTTVQYYYYTYLFYCSSITVLVAAEVMYGLIHSFISNKPGIPPYCDVCKFFP